MKSEIRSKLRDTTVSDLLTIQLCSPAIEDFDPTESVHLWNNGSRRPHTKPYGPREEKVTEEVDEDTDSGSSECELDCEMDFDFEEL